MSNLFINWRFGGWFFQVARDFYRPIGIENRPDSAPADLRWGWFRVSHLPGRPRDGEPFCAFYQGTGYALLLALLVAVLIGWAVA